MAKIRVGPQLARILTAAFAAVVLSVALLEHPSHGRGAGEAAHPSSRIAVVPGFVPKHYAGNSGTTALPVSAPELTKYHFSELPAANVTTAALQGYDTVLIYGILWSDIPTSGQAAINSFAATHKVLIWDADATGAQTYSNFVHPFSTVSSGQNYKGKENQSVVSYPLGMNFLASDDPASPYYLSQYQFIKDGDEINDMNAMQNGTANWRPALIAANLTIPDGGWVVAWSYGQIDNQTGLTIYSGMDADSFSAPGWRVNNVRNELALELAAPFSGAPASCAPDCQLPPPTEVSPHAACSFAKPVPKHWVHKRVPVVLKTGVAVGTTAQILNPAGRPLAGGRERTGEDLVRVVVPTKKLRSNRTSRLRAVILVNAKPACSMDFGLKVDNVRPRLLRVATTHGATNLLSLKVSERSWLRIVARNVNSRTRLIPARKTVQVRLPASVRTARLVLRDRAKNIRVRKVVWR